MSLTEIWTTDSQPVKLGYQESAGLITATGLGIYVNNNFVYPNGPAANQFPNMTVDKQDNLWSASGKDITGVGMYKYDGFEWETYNVENYPDLYTNSYYSIFSSSDNSIYGGSWGQGFVKINDDKILRFHTGNTDMVFTRNTANNTNFLVISGFAEDSKNNMWILNLNAADSKSLYLLTTDSTWYSFINPLEQHLTFSQLENLVIDQYGTKWYSMSNEGSLGLFYFNEKGTYTDASDDVYGYLTTSKGLTSNAIFSFAIDRRGDLWVGTGLGVNIISNLNTVLNSSNPQLRITNSFSVRQQTVNALAVDPLNQKWLGTNQGLFLLSSDGTQLLSTLDIKNSPLLSDQIESLAIDEKSGRVYVGSASGLTSFDTPSVQPVESFNGLTIYPNPLVITDGNKLVTIDGLIRNTDIKIITVSGKLVREFSSPGGRTAFWDGRDDDGNLVNSGVYIIIAFDQEGNSVETGKIAVLRE
jgi:ligand-binding sensor domain-containing protein